MATKTFPASSSTVLTETAASVLRDAKTAFLAGHRDRCGYLRITFAPADELQAIVVSALFTLPGGQEWHHADARIAATDLRRDPDAAVARAFATLADGVATVGIAQLFRPRTADAGPLSRRL